MKIGILAQYLDTRPDVREIIALLAKSHDLTVYLKQKDFQRIAPLLPDSVHIVAIPSPSRFHKVLLLIWQYIYLVFGKIPASKYNYYMVERIRLRNNQLSAFTKYSQSFLVWLSRYTQKLMSYDWYLERLALLPVNITLDPLIEVYWCNTQIYDDQLYAHILCQQKAVWTYVYSWDHPCKMKTFSNRTHYLVWNEGLKDDLIQLQGISPNLITIWGATQFTYIEHYLTTNRVTESPYPFPYVYLGCATGYDELVSQEVSYVVDIAQRMAIIAPGWRLVVRPYPFQKQLDLYAPLRDLPNVVFDDSFRQLGNEPTIDAIQDKLLKIQCAKAFFHFGTTMGYEACYFDTPSCLMSHVNSGKEKLLYGFVHQYQNDKYLASVDSLNVATTSNQIDKLLECLKDNPNSLLPYSKDIRKSTPLRSAEEMVTTFVNQIFPRNPSQTN